MGLAASQARFLGITLRKANCEYKSTELAQQRLELTQQMTDISQEYSNAMNSTKLIWRNDLICDSFGNPTDLGLSYSVLMMPTAANDYNPYMVTSKSGAIVLSSKYAQAARAAGISMAGGIPSEEGRNKFIASLANAKFDENGNYEIDYVKDANGNQVLDDDGNPIQTIVFGDSTDSLITKTTANILTGVQVVDESADVSWHYAAGLGAMPKDKAGAEEANLNMLMDDPQIGGRAIDWLQIYKSMLGLDSAITSIEKDEKLAYYDNIIAMAKNNYQHNEEVPRDRIFVADVETLTKELAMKMLSGNYYNEANVKECAEYLDSNGFSYPVPSSTTPTTPGPTTTTNVSTTYIEKALNKFKELERLMDEAINDGNKRQYKNELELLKQGLESDGVTPVDGKEESKYLYPLLWACYQYAKADYSYSQNEIKFDYLDPKYEPTICTNKDVDFGELLHDGTNHSNNPKNLIASNFNRLKNKENTESYVQGIDSNDTEALQKIKLEGFNTLTLCVGDTIMTNQQQIENMTIADLLSSNVVLMTREAGGDTRYTIPTLEVASQALMESIAKAFGYGSIGKGINVDEETNKALNYAMEMMKKKFLKAGNAVKMGSQTNDKYLKEISAYNNANEFNRICANEDSSYAAVNLSNMVSAFLTYFDNSLRGAESEYIVGKSNDSGDDYSRTNFVTDDPSYIYIKSNKDGGITNDEIMADFYNQLYNNICEHGWRYDDMVYDTEYLESAIKDGRYQLMALNKADGYFYQRRYTDVDYLIEEIDKDAIARAEVEYTNKKAQITYKEDMLDVKTKKLDAEITELNTELNSVQNIISKSIEKTFTIFSS